MRLTKAQLILLTFIGLAIIVLSVVGYGLLHDNNLSVRELQVTNVTDTAMTIVWTSDTPYKGKVYYKEGTDDWGLMFVQMGNKVAYDDRDLELDDEGNYSYNSDSAKERYTHHVTIRDLKPQTEYSFRVGGLINGKQTTPAAYYTFPIVDSLQTPDPAYGQITGATDADSLVIFNLIGVRDYYGPTVISTTVNPEGRYSQDFSYYKLNESINAKDFVVQVRDREGIYSGIKFEINTYKPLEDIILSEE